MVIAAALQGSYCPKIQASAHASFTWNVGQMPTRLPWVEASCLFPFFSSTAELFVAKHFSRMTPRGKNELACFGKSCWQFPVEVVEGGVRLGLAVPIVSASFVYSLKFRPKVML